MKLYLVIKWEIPVAQVLSSSYDTWDDHIAGVTLRNGVNFSSKV